MGVCCSTQPERLYSKNLKQAHSDSITAIHQLRDGTIITGSKDNTVGVWDLDTLANLKILKDHQNQITRILQLDDGTLATVSDDRAVTQWDPIKGFKKLKNLKGTENFISCVIKLRDGRIAISSWDRMLIIWNPNANFSCEAIMTDHIDEIDDIIQLRDGSLATSSKDNTVRIWDTDTWVCKNIITLSMGKTPHTPVNNRLSVPAIIELSDGKLVTASYDKSVKVFEPKTFNLLYTLSGHDKVVTQAAQLNEKHLLTTGDDKVIVWDISSEFGKVSTLDLHNNTVTTLLVLKDGKHFATGSLDKSVRIWDNKLFQCSYVLEGHSDGVTAMHQLKDGRLVTGCSDGCVKIWGF
jgi:WD40 repeat protein